MQYNYKGGFHVLISVPKGEEYHITNLLELKDTEVDMFTTVFIGNANTKVIDDKMVTPRGYEGV